MAAVPHALIEDPPHFLDGSRDKFTMRRELVPVTTGRGHDHHNQLPSVFEGAHAWPLAWGGAEVRDAIWNAHRVVNKGFQADLERAGVRLAKRLEGTGVRLFVRIEMERYIERDLLKAANYRFEAVWPDGTMAVLGEARIEQSLTQVQRRALVEGKILMGADGGKIVIDFRGTHVKINPRSMVVASPMTGLGDVENKLDVLTNGMARGLPRTKITTTTPSAAGTTGGAGSGPAAGPAGRQGTGSPATQGRATDDDGGYVPAISTLSRTPPPEKTRAAQNERISKHAQPLEPGALSGGGAKHAGAEALGTMLHDKMMAGLDAQVGEDLERALDAVEFDIQKWQRRGYWVRVSASFTMPKAIDLTIGVFRGSDQYLKFHSLAIAIYPEVTIGSPVGGLGPHPWKRQVFRLDNTPTAPNAQYSAGGSFRKVPAVPANRKVVTHREILKLMNLDEEDEAGTVLPWGVFPPIDAGRRMTNGPLGPIGIPAIDDARRAVAGRCTNDDH